MINLASLLIRILFCLTITIIIEVGLAFILKVRDKYDLCIITYTNLGTNVPANIILILLYSITLNKTVYYIGVIIFEIAIFFIEALIFKHNLETKKNKYLLSLLLNLSSFLLGSFICMMIFN